MQVVALVRSASHGALLLHGLAGQELARRGLDGKLSESEFYRLARLGVTSYGMVMPKRFMDPERWLNQDVGRTFAQLSMKDRYHDRVSFAVFSTEYMDSLAKLLQGLKVHEVCARRGVLQRPMRGRGIDWTCSDLDPQAPHVEQLDALDALAKHQPDVVFASWIDLGYDLDQQLASKLPMIIVGESCTGSFDEGFFDNPNYTIQSPPKGFQDLPRFDCLNDATLFTHPKEARLRFEERFGTLGWEAVVWDEG